MSSFLVKLETRSQRVKGVSFHPTRPWVLCGLHNGQVQIWDYRTNTNIEKFEEHDGPVRGVDFHKHQPMFVTGADDYKIKVWNFKLRRCLFTLVGHLDYIRTVQFHHDQPWIVSASDDQTLRIWNWQSRGCVSVLTGHNHYVMSAQFHPRDDLIVSSCLDLTIRVWDISGLRAKKQDSSIALPQDLFGSNDVAVKFILEGHEKGVNWASFHPTKPYIVSASDDRSVRVWRMDEVRSYEQDHLRGHSNNVSCVCYFKDQIVSNSEDKTIRVWDSNSRTASQTHRKDNERFWVIAAHPEKNLLAAGHDNGLMVFKLERERSAFCMRQNKLYWVKDRTIRCYDFDSRDDRSVISLRRNQVPPFSLSVSPAGDAAAVWYDYDSGQFELYGFNDSDVKKGFYTSAVFFSSNKFALLDRSRQVVIRTTGNDISKVLPPVGETDRLFPAPQGHILCRAEDRVALFDVAQKSVVSEVIANKVKYVVWDSTSSKVALLSKHSIVVATRRLKQIATVHETASRIKSAVFDEERGVLFYATSSHLKYLALASGETATLKTLEDPIYLVRCKLDTLWYITREAKLVEDHVDNTELNFKLAVQQERYRDVLRLINEGKVHGQALVAYLHKSNHPDIALHFVEDPSVKFNLALECGMLDIAKQTADELQSPECWRALANAAAKFGDIQLARTANAKLKNFYGVGMQCVVTGDMESLSQVINKCPDDNFKMQYSLFTGEAMTRIKLLANAGQLPLAYSLARSSGAPDEIAEELLEKMDPVVAERCRNIPVQRNTMGTRCAEPQADNWPMLPAKESLFTRMLKEPGAFDYQQEAQPNAGDKWGDDSDLDLGDDEPKDDLLGDDLGEEKPARTSGGDAGNWEDSDLDLGDDVPAAPVAVAGKSAGGFVVPREGESFEKHWCDTTNMVTYHIAGGNFQSALQLLQRQICLVDATPLEQHFIQIWNACHAVLPTWSILPQHIHACATSPGSTDMRGKHAPLLPKLLPALRDKLQQAYTAFTEARFSDAKQMFVSLMHQLIFVVADRREDSNDIREMLSVAREYVSALHIELYRKETTTNAPPRVVELASYITHYKLQSSHKILVLNQAATLAFKAGLKKTSGIMARRLLDEDPPQERANKARQIIAKADENPNDATKIDYDDRNPFSVCVCSMTPMYRGRVDPIRCPFCFAPAKPEFRGQKCPICQISMLGGEASGMLNSVSQN